MSDMYKVPGLFVVASLSLISTVGAFYLGKSQSNFYIERKAKSDEAVQFEPPAEDQSLDQSLDQTKRNDRSKESMNSAEDSSILDSITLQPIGKIASVYRLCVGTPRQGLLAPNSRGRIDLNRSRISSDSIIDLDKFSHVWVVFIFHLNSNTKQVKRSQAKIEDGKETKRQFPAKIAPPALGGKRVGVFATRTPHRPNPVGFSLCKIDKIVKPKKKKHLKQADQPYSIYVSGLDLVDGTPVLDIKPYVPHYDSIGYSALDSNRSDMETNKVVLPQWVSDGLEKRRPVEFSPKAEADLQSIMDSSEAREMEFYGTHTGRDSSQEEAVLNVRSCIEEVLSVDVRSAWQTGKARKGRFQAERAQRVRNVTKEHSTSNNLTGMNANEEADVKICTQQLDRLLIQYSVESTEQKDTFSAVDTKGSGADDIISVRSISMIPKKK